MRLKAKTYSTIIPAHASQNTVRDSVLDKFNNEYPNVTVVSVQEHVMGGTTIEYSERFTIVIYYYGDDEDPHGV